MTMTKNYLSTKETARRLEASQSTVKNMIRDGLIKAEKLVPGIKSVYRIPADEVERILKERKQQK